MRVIELPDYAMTRAAALALDSAPPVGIRVPEAELHGWLQWPAPPRPGHGFLLGRERAPRAVLWLEPDAFNTAALKTGVVNVRWALNRKALSATTSAGALVPVLRRLLARAGAGLQATRVLGQDPLALGLLQAAGFRFIVDQLRFFRPPGPPPATRPGVAVSFELRDLRTAPLDGTEIDRAAELARECLVPDRFLLDPAVPGELARRRQVEIVRNALGGSLAMHAVLARRPDEELAGLAFFAADPGPPPRAGDWLTALVRSGERERGLGAALLAHAMAGFHGDPPAWTCTCSVHNRASIAALHAAGFRLGAAVAEFHRWNLEPARS